MTTAGIVISAVGVLLFLIGAGLHLNNMRNMFDSEKEPSGGKAILPFVISLPGVVLFWLGVILFVIGYVIPLFT